MTDTIDHLNGRSRSVYDGLDRVKMTFDELDRPTLFGYDAAGNLLWSEDAEGARVAYD